MTEEHRLLTDAELDLLEVAALSWDLVLAFDFADGFCQHALRGMAADFQRDAREFLGCPAYDYLVGFDPRLIEEHGPALRAGNPVRFDADVLENDGRQVPGRADLRRARVGGEDLIVLLWRASGKA
jgi:hypothetical protein